MKRLVIDLDGTLTHDDPKTKYHDKQPNLDVVSKLRAYKELGFEIVIATSRNMRTFDGNIGRINAVTLPAIIEWLKRHDVPYDEIHVGKPWCGQNGFYVDDKALRPEEFVNLEYHEIVRLLGLLKDADQ